MMPCQMKPTLIRAPPVINGYSTQTSDGKNVAQYEAVFLQLADEHRTVNAFELHELLEACLPNGNFVSSSNDSVLLRGLLYFDANVKFYFCVWGSRLHQKLRKFGRLPATRPRL